jgi:biopolymer transport protein ExbD
MSEGKKSTIHLPQADAEVDLVPLIDCVFLLLLFFMLCGRIAMDQRAEQISVPPTKTSTKPPPPPKDWEHYVVNVFGSTKEGKPPRNAIKVGAGNVIFTEGTDNLAGYQKLRQELNTIYDRAQKYPDAKNPELKLPQVVLEIRADADTEYRVVQEIQQVASDTINPFDSMKPRTVPMSQMRTFVLINFTTRRPEDKK